VHCPQKRVSGGSSDLKKNVRVWQGTEEVVVGTYQRINTGGASSPHCAKRAGDLGVAFEWSAEPRHMLDFFQNERDKTQIHRATITGSNLCCILYFVFRFRRGGEVVAKMQNSINGACQWRASNFLLLLSQVHRTSAWNNKIKIDR
jgi:hypothetical protein